MAVGPAPSTERPERTSGRGWAGRFGAHERREALVVLVIVLIAVALRLAWRAETLTTWDSILFALALHDFDVYSAQPHAPGYPVYIALAALIAPLAPDANAALVAVSVLFSAGTLVVLYRFVRLSAPVGVAAAATVLFSFAPAFLYNGVIATTYTAEAFFSVLLALVAWHLIQRPSIAGGFAAGVVFGLALGVRTSLLFFLAPLVAVALLWPLLASWRRDHPQNDGHHASRGARADDAAAERSDARRLGIRQPLAAGMGGAFAVALWVVPMAVQSQGWARYLAATSYQSREVVFGRTVWRAGWDALVEHTGLLALFLEPEWPVLLVALLAGALTLVAWWRRGPARDRTSKQAPDAPAGDPSVPPQSVIRSRRAPTTQAVPLWFYALWVAPSILFYLLVFAGWGNGPSGYILVFLPAMHALLAVAAHRAARAFVASWPRLAATTPRHERLVAVVAILVVLAPLPLLAQASEAVVAREVRAHDEWTEAWGHLPGTFPPNETAILSSYSWAHIKWYLPDYLAWGTFVIRQSGDNPLAAYDEHGAGARRFLVETRHRSDEVPLYAPHLDAAMVREHPIPDWVQRVVVFDFQLAGENGVRQLAPDVTVEETTLSNGWRVLYFHPDPARETIEEHLVPLGHEAA